MNNFVNYLAKAKPALSKAKPILTSIKNMPVEKHASYVFLRIKVVFFALMFVKFCTVVTTNHYLLKPFSVPPAFDKSGYNGTMLTAQVVNYMEDIRNFKDPSTARGNAYRQIGKTFRESEVSLVENSTSPTIYDPDTWFKAGKKILSSIDRFKEKSITASIVEDTQDSTKVLLTVQVTHKAVRQAAISHPKKIGDRAFFHFVAFEILKETDPIALFDYYIKEDSLLGKADTLLKYLNDNSEFRKDRTNQFRLDVSTINFKLAKAHYLRRESRKKMVSDDDEANNDSEQRKMRDEALRLAHELIENNPNDLSAYVQEFSCLAFSCNWLYYLDPEEDKHDINQGKIDSVEWKKHFDELLADFKGKEKSLNTEFYDDAHSRAYIKATIGYLEQYFYQISDDKDDKIELHYKEALEISKEEDVFILNSAAYFYANREIRKRKKAYNYIEKAINLRPYDGNLMDSYADIALSFGDTAKFYKYFEKALENQKPIDGITIQEYEKDTRLKKMWDKPEFRALMRKYKSRIFDEPINEAETSDLAAETPQTKPKPLAVKWLKRKKKP